MLNHLQGTRPAQIISESVVTITSYEKLEHRLLLICLQPAHTEFSSYNCKPP